jgi:hypothetical protein
MRNRPPEVHGVLDHPPAAIIIAGPIPFDFDSTAATVIALAFGAASVHPRLRRQHGRASRLRERRWAPGRRRAVVADLRGDVEWTADGCEATVFTAAPRRR